MYSQLQQTANEMQLTNATWWLVAATFSLAITGIGGILFAWLQLHNERSHRRVENLEHQLEIWESDRYRKIRSDLANARLKNDTLCEVDPSDPPHQAYEILDFFEHVALLVKHGNISNFQVWHTFGPWIAPTWSDLKTVVAVEQVDDPATHRDFSWLVKKMRRIERKNGGSFMKFDDPDLESHYAYEQKLAIDGNGVRSRPRKQRKPKKEWIIDSSTKLPPEQAGKSILPSTQ